VYYLSSINLKNLKIYLSALVTGDIYAVAHQWLPDKFLSRVKRIERKKCNVSKVIQKNTHHYYNFFKSSDIRGFHSGK